MSNVRTDHSFRVAPHTGADRGTLLGLVPSAGAALLEGWSDGGAWTIALPWPEEIIALPWSRANEWVEFVRSIETRARNDAKSSASRLNPNPPFCGGWVGFISYDAGATTEGAIPPSEVPPEPAAWFARHESGLLIDPEGNGWAFGPRERPDDAGVRTPIEIRLDRPQESHPGVEDSLGSGGYEETVGRIRERIRDGEVYQVNLTRRLTSSGRFDASDFYRRLTGSAPPRCSALIHGEGWSVASASPEVLLVMDRRQGVVESRPIKGTMRRKGRDDEEVAALLASGKDASEHLMIVDLVRNDLGKIAPPGGVSVPAFRTIRTLPYAYHLESTVRADVLEDRSVADVLGALFPGGSITGAPKRAAVQTIRELEHCPRGVYTGAIGFIGHDGRSAFSVAIRTAVVTGDGVRYHAGGGIVWDSNPGDENAEAMTKAEPFLKAIEEHRGA